MSEKIDMGEILRSALALITVASEGDQAATVQFAADLLDVKEVATTDIDIIRALTRGVCLSAAMAHMHIAMLNDFEEKTEISVTEVLSALGLYLANDDEDEEDEDPFC